jgi:hypothetical protein
MYDAPTSIIHVENGRVCVQASSVELVAVLRTEVTTPRSVLRVRGRITLAQQFAFKILPHVPSL